MVNYSALRITETREVSGTIANIWGLVVLVSDLSKFFKEWQEKFKEIFVDVIIVAIYTSPYDFFLDMKREKNFDSTDISLRTGFIIFS